MVFWSCSRAEWWMVLTCGLDMQSLLTPTVKTCVWFHHSFPFSIINLCGKYNCITVGHFIRNTSKYTRAHALGIHLHYPVVYSGVNNHADTGHERELIFTKYEWDRKASQDTAESRERPKHLVILIFTCPVWVNLQIPNFALDLFCCSPSASRSGMLFRCFSRMQKRIVMWVSYHSNKALLPSNLLLTGCFHFSTILCIFYILWAWTTQTCPSCDG